MFPMPHFVTMITWVRHFTIIWVSRGMIERFVDTSGWAEFVDRTLLFHRLDVAKFDEVWNQGGRLITTNLVFVELTALLTRPLRMPKSQQVQLIGDLQADPSIEMV